MHISADISHSCYTNHALDQFVEHLIAISIEKIIRIGGQFGPQYLKGKTYARCPKARRGPNMKDPS
jgi:hypothetical protein